MDLWLGGLPFTNSGSLVIQMGVPPADVGWVGGLAVDSNGVYCVEIAPPVLNAWSNGFAGGFGV